MIQQTNQFYTSTWHFGVHNSYNERGQLIYKKLHGGIQSIDYKYNIRGWLTQINNPENFTKDGSGDTQADLYAMRLNYNTLETGVMTDSAKLRYGGDITSMIWNTSGKGKKSYGFAYDGLDRLKSSDYKVYSGSVWLDSTSFEERNINYDKNGNFLTLLRTREKGDTMNNFSYGYKGNQLDTLFNRKTGLKYLYDGNGNMTTDGLRGFNLQYNILNLPRSISKSTDTILYIYSATGEKLAKRMKDKTYQYYAGNMVYNTSRVFDYLLTEEGMVKYASGSFTYEYFLKDHLGNTRLAFKPNSGSSTVEQATEYYPFGATLGLIDPNVNSNKYLYNGKELQDDVIDCTALDWYDYGARFYDPQIGRFHTPDRFAEKYLNMTPYQYGANNPVLMIDINGDSIKVNGFTEKSIVKELGSGLGVKKADNPFYFEDGNLAVDEAKYNALSDEQKTIASNIKTLAGDTKEYTIRKSKDSDPIPGLFKRDPATGKTVPQTVGDHFAAAVGNVPAGGTKPDYSGNSGVTIYLTGKKPDSTTPSSIVLYHELGGHGLYQYNWGIKDQGGHTLIYENRVRALHGLPARPFGSGGHNTPALAGSPALTPSAPLIDNSLVNGSIKL